MSEVVTLGCRLNLAESEAIRALLPADEPLIVVNSCAVTAEAVRQTRQAIRRAHSRRPEARIVVTGCASELEPEVFAAMPEVAAVVRNAEKLRASAYFPSPDGRGREPRSGGRVRVLDHPHPARLRRVDPLPMGEGHARAFIAVQNGCDHDCTFCVTTLARGASRSAPGGEVIAAVRAAVERGHREAVLTGVDLTSYGADLPGQPTLGLLVERILRHVPALPRLRLSSLDPAAIDARLFELIASEPRVMPHAHLSLQAGDDLILKRMKRRHSRRDAVRLVERLKARRDVAIGADLIAGFPTESEAMAQNSLNLLEDCDVVHAHIFPYSPRPGTAAARMPQAGREVARARAARLREAARARQARWLAGLVGTRQRVLVELDGASGHAENFARVLLPASPRGEIAPMTIEAATPTHLVATPA